jgi:vacuolar-type H+-ATPase subunit I/STV1
MADRLRLTVAEAAEALAVSDDTIRRGLAGAGPLADLLRDAGHRDNTGRWVIELTAEEIERHRSIRRRQPTPPQGPLAAPAEAELPRLRERLDAMRSAAESASGAHKEEIQRLAEGHQAELARLAAAHAAELGRIRADLDHERAERRVEAERAAEEQAALVAALSDALRPWWRRLLGPR